MKWKIHETLSMLPDLWLMSIVHLVEVDNSGSTDECALGEANEGFCYFSVAVMATLWRGSVRD